MRLSALYPAMRIWKHNRRSEKRPNDGRIFIKTVIEFWQISDNAQKHESESKGGIHLPSLRFNFTNYYMQEELAQLINTLSVTEFNSPNPIIEFYIAKGISCLQKSPYRP